MSRKKLYGTLNRPKLWKRALSFLIDLIVINTIIIWPFQGLFYGYANINMQLEALPMNVYLAVMLIFVLAWLYFSFMEYYLGQSLGQMLMRLKISEDIGLWKALVRNCFMLPFFPFYILWIAEPLYLAFYKDRLLEKLTRTSTVSMQMDVSHQYKLKKV